MGRQPAKMVVVQEPELIAKLSKMNGAEMCIRDRYGLAHISAECYEIIIDISAELLCGV